MKEVEFGNVTFRINKILPLTGEVLLVKHIAPFLGTIFSAPAPDATKPPQIEPEADPDTGEIVSAPKISATQWLVWQTFIAGLANLPYLHYAAIRNELFKGISFQRQDMDDFKQLTNDEPYAFQGCSPAHIVMLVMEAFRENFTESFTDFLSRVTMLGVIGASLSGLATSAPSSQP